MGILIQHADGSFWTGAGFSHEYPDAVLFQTKSDAKRELKAISKLQIVRIVADYGLDTEREL